jgi:hypothetical protein
MNMVGMKSDIGGKKRGPKKGSKDKPRIKKAGAVMPSPTAIGAMGLNMKKGRRSEKSPKAAIGTQKFF